MATKKATAKTGDERKKDILDCAAKLVGKHGAKNITRRMVANECKVSESLVAHYFGNTADAQKKYRAHAKKLGIAEPSKEQIEAIGAKLRAHGPRAKKVVRKKAAKAPTVALPKPPKAAKKVAKKATAAKKSARSSTPAKKSSATAATAPKRKSAARAPKAPPSLPPPPVFATDGAPLPPLPTFN